MYNFVQYSVFILILPCLFQLSSHLSALFETDLKRIKSERGQPPLLKLFIFYFFVYFFGRLECVGHFFLLMSPILDLMRDVWIQIQKAAVASRRDINLATHLLKTFNA